MKAGYSGLTIEATASIGGTGLLVDHEARILNLGTVDANIGVAVTLTAGGAVINGATTDRSAQMQGVELANVAGTVINYASISSTADGVYLRDGGVVTNGTNGDTRATIIGTRDGVYGAPFVAGRTTVTNFGTIIGGAAVVIRTTGGGVVVNGSPLDRKALIEGDGGAGFGVVSGYPTTVTNYGTIEGFIGGNGSDTVINSGLVTGKVRLYPGPSGLVVAQAGCDFAGGLDGGNGALELASATGTISGLGGAGVLSGAVSGAFGDFGRYSIDAGGSWTLAGTNTVAAGKTLTDNGAVTNTGVLTVDWTVSGAGSLDFAAGSATLATGAAVGTASWSITGGATTIGEFLYFTGSFSQGAAATLSIASGARLFLLGTAALSGTIDGVGNVTASDLSLGALTIGGKARLNPIGTARQTGTVTVGDASTNGAKLVIGTAAVYTIDGPVGIARGHSNRSSLEILGALVRSGSAGVSDIAVAAIDDGTVEAAVGTLDFSNALTGTGSLLIDGGATLEADKTVASTLTVTFETGAETLALATPMGFAATIAGFAVGDSVDLLSIAATGASVNGADRLVIVNGGRTVASLQLSGSYAGATFRTASDGHGGTSVTMLSVATSRPWADAATATAPVQSLIGAMGSFGAPAAATARAADHPAMSAPMFLTPAAHGA